MFGPELLMLSRPGAASEDLIRSHEHQSTRSNCGAHISANSIAVSLHTDSGLIVLTYTKPHGIRREYN